MSPLDVPVMTMTLSMQAERYFSGLVFFAAPGRRVPFGG
jgi:hypothetical protein